MPVETLELPPEAIAWTRSPVIFKDQPVAELEASLEETLRLRLDVYLQDVARAQRELWQYRPHKDKALQIASGAETSLQDTITKSQIVSCEMLDLKRGAWRLSVIRLIVYDLLDRIEEKLRQDGTLAADRHLLPYGYYQAGRDSALLIPLSGNPIYGAQTLDPGYAEDFAVCPIFEQRDLQSLLSRNYLAALQNERPINTLSAPLRLEMGKRDRTKSWEYRK